MSSTRLDAIAVARVPPMARRLGWRCVILMLLGVSPLHAQETAATPPVTASSATVTETVPAPAPAAPAAATPEMPSETAERHAAQAEAAARLLAGNLEPTETEAVFLDRLMMAESGGRSDAKNPRSTALGPYQFIAGTFLDVISRHFAAAMEGRSDGEILQLRTDHTISRKAALVYTRENAAFLLDRGHEASAAHLRLAFLVGPGGATRVIGADPKTPVSQLLGAGVLEANPFMNGMTAADLIQRAAREASGIQLATLPMDRRKRSVVGGIRIRCNLGRPSCRRWVMLANRRLARQTSAAASAPARAADARKPSR